MCSNCVATAAQAACEHRKKVYSGDEIFVAHHKRLVAYCCVERKLTMNTKTKYAARATKAQKWTVARWTGFEWKPLGDVQWFDSFENADECAREIAAGKYEQWTAGEYVSLR